MSHSLSCDVCMQIHARVTAKRQKGGSEREGPGNNLSHGE